MRRALHRRVQLELEAGVLVDSLLGNAFLKLLEDLVPQPSQFAVAAFAPQNLDVADAGPGQLVQLEALSRL